MKTPLNQYDATETDSYNLLVPHSECKGTVDLYKEYASVRGPDIAIPKDELHQIKVPAGNQPCNVMGIHPDLKILKDLYDDGDAVMFANMGAMVEVRARNSGAMGRRGRERNTRKHLCAPQVKNCGVPTDMLPHYSSQSRRRSSSKRKKGCRQGCLRFVNLSS